MDGHEHRDIGDAATGGALVNLGATSPGGRFRLGFGDVMALAGDYFTAGEPAASAEGADTGADALGQSLFGLARVAGRKGTTPGTRDEILCALHVMAVDERYADPRFSRGGAFADLTFGYQGALDDVERRVRDRYVQLAATNDDHFVAPGGVTHGRGPGRREPFGSAILAYRLGQGLVEPYGLLATPLLGDWLGRRGRAAYHRGFVEPLARQPKDVILSVIDAAPAATAAARPGMLRVTPRGRLRGC